MMHHYRLILILLVGMSLGLGTAHAKQDAGFAKWVSQFKAKAQQQGIQQSTLDKVFKDVSLNATVIKLDRKQPEGKISFTQYRKNIVNKKRVNEGRKQYQKHKALLEKIAAHYGVPAPYIVALWGTETNYGSFTGKTSTVAALATLAYEGRRAAFFQEELLILLKLFDQQEITDVALRGSWAGAMGHSQFMPSSFQQFAVDWNGNGKKDIWRELPDVFASIANYLKTEGWDQRQPWGVAIRRPAARSFVYDDLYTPLSYTDVRKQKLVLANGKSVPPFAGNAYAMHPGEPNEGSFLVYDNYHVLLKWNRSRYFATAVGLLADKIAAK